jgi:hypothetical protein
MAKTKKGEIKICPKCGAEFYLSPSSLLRRKIPFCSYDCKSAAKLNLDIDVYIKHKDFLCYLTPIKSRTSKSTKYNQSNLSVQDIKRLWEKQNGKCAISGVDLELFVPVCNCKASGRKPRDDAYKSSQTPLRTASLDRIDSSIGYTADNVQFISAFLNLAKGPYSDKQVVLMLKEIIEKNIDGRRFKKYISN